MTDKPTFRLDDYTYDIPQDRIAYYPSEIREESKLLVVKRDSDKFIEKKFYKIIEYLLPGDTIVLNNTKVFPARLHGHKETGGKVEIFLLHRETETQWSALTRPGRRLPPGTRVIISNGVLEAEMKGYSRDGSRMVRFYYKGDFWKLIEELGEIPLPPYIKRQPEELDKKRYQTVYAEEIGAVAAPTAGFHFSNELLHEIKKREVSVANVTLHVGWGTFQKVQTDDIRKHEIEKEYYVLSEETAEIVNHTKRTGGRVIAVGTTSVRVLETAGKGGMPIKASSGWTQLYIYPSFEYKVVDVLITNFHLPGSSLILLVSAFAGREKIMAAYNYALKNGFRFYSYGDAMIII
ncbi:tRNA preQ1(34) S-adenosylmethionine ribosyltransferase-isomerase QueA [bacterium]|nr:tRNA preQ1(34) S-adenosylmethionine ribosyltransferase-isomerase QueA [bacterium]